MFVTRSPKALFVNYVNGGVNPEFRDEFNPGSILTYLNVREAESRSEGLGLALRYSFGWRDNAYKDSVADPVPVYWL